MRILNRLLAITVLALAPVFTAYADESTNLYLHTKTGEKIGFSFAGTPKITFNRSNALVIKSATTEMMVKGFSTVHKITFGDAAGHADVVTDTKGVITPGENNTITLSGFADNTLVTVYNLNGQILRTLRTIPEGTTEISLNVYGKGTYIITACEVVCKIAIK